MKCTVTVTDYPSPFYPYKLEWKFKGSSFNRSEVFANKDRAISYARCLYSDTTIVDKTVAT